VITGQGRVGGLSLADFACFAGGLDRRIDEGIDLQAPTRPPLDLCRDTSGSPWFLDWDIRARPWISRANCGPLQFPGRIELRTRRGALD
jgi:hypothetical protein